MPPEEFNQLSEAEREKVQEKIGKLQRDLEKFLYRVPRWQRQSQRKIRELDREFTRVTVDGVMEEMRRDWQDHEEVLEYFDAVRDDVVDNVKDFLGDEAGQQQALAGIVQQGESEQSLRRYRVNVLVDNGQAEGAPVITEDHPRYQNLFGTIEHTSRMGALFTDFTLIKGGALHRANGGYLVVEARKLLTQPLAWDGLKRALFSGQLRVEPPDRELLPMVSTVSLEPEAMTLDVKVVLIGSRRIYQLLNQLDPEFGQLFKVAADFEQSMPRNDGNQERYARMVAGLVRREKLLPLDREATARVIEQGAREAEDAERLSIHKEGSPTCCASPTSGQGNAGRRSSGARMSRNLWMCATIVPAGCPKGSARRSGGGRC
jgi:predicted ATP-dependent protease